MLIFPVRGKSKTVILRETREVCPFLLRNVAGSLQLPAQSWFGESQFCKSTFPLSLQLSEAIDEGCEVNFHFKTQVNDTKYLYVCKIWHGESMAGAAVVELQRRHKFSLISLLFLVGLLCFETVSSALSCLQLFVVPQKNFSIHWKKWITVSTKSHYIFRPFRL